MTRRKSAGVGIKWSLFTSFCVFALLILFLFWLAIGLFSSNLYFWMMRGRMDNTAYEIMLLSGAPDFEEKAEFLAQEEQAGLLVYRINGSEASLIASARYDVDGILQELDGDWINTLYTRAAEENGKARVRLCVDGATGEIYEETGLVTNSNTRLLSVMLTERPNGTHYMVVLETSFALPSSVLRITQRIMLILSLFLLGIATGLSFVLAKHISRPIERLTQRATQLSGGEFRKEAHGKSYREIDELAETLEHAAEELSRVDRLQREFIANVSHDLRTPLTMIAGYAEVMRDIEGENTPENVQVIIDETERLSSLVNDLLEISDIQSADASLSCTRFSLSEMVAQTVARYRRLKGCAGFVFSFEGAPALDVYADQKRILQVLCNLLNNAVNYAGEDKKIEVRCKCLGDVLRTEIEDHGQGIAEDELESIWQRYYKAKQSHRRATVGSGLGLSIVREILDRHGARYGVISRVGVGSIFWFELPIVTAAEEPSRKSE